MAHGLTPQVLPDRGKGAYLERMGFEIGMNIKVVEVGRPHCYCCYWDLEDSVCLEN